MQVADLPPTKNPRSLLRGFFLPLEFGLRHRTRKKDTMDPVAPPNLPTDRISWWARQHALILLIGVTAAWLERSGLLLAAMAGASMLAAFRIPGTATADSPTSPTGRLLSLCRILIALGLIVEPNVDVHITLTALAILTTLQLLEAWRHRIRNPLAIQPALIEQETDALWLVSLTFLVAPLTPMGNGIIGLALVRPIWVMASHWTGPPACPMPWDFKTRAMSGIFVLGLSAPLLSALPQSLSHSLAIAGGMGWITLHAHWAFRVMNQKRQPPEET